MKRTDGVPGGPGGPHAELQRKLMKLSQDLVGDDRVMAVVVVRTRDGFTTVGTGVQTAADNLAERLMMQQSLGQLGKMLVQEAVDGEKRGEN